MMDVATKPYRSSSIPINAKWKQDGVTIAGGHKHGDRLNQLHCPYGIYVDGDQTVFVADLGNHRIVEWKSGATSGHVVAGGNGQGNQTDQLREPSNVIVNKEADSLFISDSINRRVMRWSRQSGITSGEMIIENIACEGLAMDDSKFLYVADSDQHEVRRYEIGSKKGIVVAGGYGQGYRLNQLNYPTQVFVDDDHSVYVSDNQNHRIVKWIKDAKEGIIVAGGDGEGNNLAQLSRPQGIVIDSLGTVYVADFGNHRIMRWNKGATHGDIVIGGNGSGTRSNQLNSPVGLSFDYLGNMYVVDFENDRVQKFLIETTC